MELDLIFSSYLGNFSEPAFYNRRKCLDGATSLCELCHLSPQVNGYWIVG